LPRIEIRTIERHDNTDDFQCGTVALDEFLKRYAKQNQFRHHIGTTYVALLDKRIVGYVTLSAGSIRTEELNEALRRRLPDYPLPILRLSRLAVDRRYHGRGLGKLLLKFSMKMALKQKELFGCFGLVVDAKEESVTFYKQFGFSPFDTLAGALNVRPYPKSMFLAVKTIEKGVEANSPISKREPPTKAD